MTVALTPSPTLAAAPPARPRGRWRRRWPRVAVPFALFALLAVITTVAHVAEEPNLRDADTLAPTGAGPDGSSRLAALLAERGVVIQPVSGLEEAAAMVDADGDAVVFMPKPNLIGSALAAMAIEQGHRVVMVAPADRHLWFAPVHAGHSRWASTAVPPDCGLPEAVAAGPATALRHRYVAEGPTVSCYDQGLVRTQVRRGELFVIGSTDPFRNSRIDEHGNATLAVELLAAYDRVIWAGSLRFDLELEFEQAEFDVRFPELNRPQRGDRDPNRSAGFEDLFYGYPTAVVAGLVLALLVGLLLAFARGRRLGPPVREPLPVVVPAAEAVAGRGRLYQRSRGRGAALEALRVAARRRLVTVLGLSAAPPDPETVVAAVAARTGLPADQVRHTLYGPEPANDADLAATVAALDHLVEWVTSTRGDPRNRGVQP